MNYLITVVKIIHIDYRLYYNARNKVYWLEFYGKLPTQSVIVKIIIWGNYLKDIIAYYTLKDYIIIEGHISIHLNKKLNQNEGIKFSITV